MLVAVELFFSLASALLAGAALSGSTQAWRHESHPVDFAMRVLAASWMLYLLIGVSQLAAMNGATWVPLLPAWVVDTGLECLLASLAFFLLTAAGAVRPWILTVLGLQFFGGLIAASWSIWQSESSPQVQRALMAATLAAAVCVVAVVLRQVHHTHSRRSWLVSAACATGFGLWLHQAATAGSVQSVLPVVYHLYAVFIFVVWKLISLNADADKALANASTPFSGATNFQSVASIRSDDDFIALALRGERQRISSELHDNVGSQLVSLLFAVQGTDLPKKRFVMLSLEQCLSDLKMMVDALDSFDEDVTQALGRLRYRVQHALDRQGINMRWELDVSPELEAVQGIYAQQVLRIAQESLGNVMRHAKATSVKVNCRYVPEFCHLLLEVVDNGAGIKTDGNDRVQGRGLASMKRRAAVVGGFLQISSQSGRGTCVRLTLPLTHLKAVHKTVAEVVLN